MLAGFAAGAIHVMTGPDHLAAISPIAIDNRKSPSIVGLKWGIGHTGGVCLIGGLALLLREIIPINFISGYSERLVGITLVFIGLWGIRKAYMKKALPHKHLHAGQEHAHPHLHHGNEHNSDTQTTIHTHTAFGVGIIHGFAGSSHIVGILPALAFTSRVEAVLYLLFFGIGTVLAMVAFSSAVGMVTRRLEIKGAVLFQRMLAVFSGFAVCLGVYWIFN